MRALRVVLPLLVLGAGLDLATKAWARAALDPADAALDFLPFVSLHLTYNYGISFGFLAVGGEASRWLLVGFTALLTLAVTAWAFSSRDARERVTLAVIASGALGNVLDRLMFGRVTDFLDLHFGSWHPFVFNLADVWITLGAAVLFLLQWHQNGSPGVPEPRDAGRGSA